MDIGKKNLTVIGLVGLLALFGIQYYYFEFYEPGQPQDRSISLLDKKDGPPDVDSAKSETSAAVGMEQLDVPTGSSGKKIEVRRLESLEKRKQLLDSIQMASKLREMWKKSGLSEEELEKTGQSDRGTLSRETIQAAVGAVIGDVKSCYDRQLEETPELWGRMVVHFVIVAEEGIGGIVDSVDISDESDKAMRDSSDLIKCIVDTIYTLELPEPEGGGQVEVSYPLIMRPGGDSGK